MSKLFYNCSLLMSISAIFELDSPSVYDISELFYNCSSLEKIPNIFNIKNMNELFFYNCSSLILIPYIYKHGIPIISKI